MTRILLLRRWRTPRPASATFRGGLALAILALAATLASADDFWLVPSAFDLAPASTLEVRGQTSGRFPTSRSAVAVNRVADARLISRGREEPIANFAIDGTSLVLRHRPRRAGQYAVAVSLKPRAVRESVAGFLEYLEAEGAPEARARLEREGTLANRDSVTRRYAKYAKTFVQVGRGGPRAFAAVAGYPLEMVLLRDPFRLRGRDTLRLRLLFRGAPLAGARLTAGAVAHTGTVSEPAPTVSPDTMLITNNSGEVLLRVGAAGLWNVRGIHIEPAAPGSGADWDTHWASVVFHVRGR